MAEVCRSAFPSIITAVCLVDLIDSVLCDGSDVERSDKMLAEPAAEVDDISRAPEVVAATCTARINMCR